jgi:hypothetical protein
MKILAQDLTTGRMLIQEEDGTVYAAAVDLGRIARLQALLRGEWHPTTGGGTDP